MVLSPAGRASAAATGCVACWGAVFVGVHQLLPELDPVQIVTLRFSIVALVFMALLAARPAWRPPLSRRQLPLFAVAGVAAVLGGQLPIIDGQRFLSPPIAALIVTFAPAVAALLAAVFAGERVRSRQALGFAIGLAGVALVLILGAGSGADLHASNPLRASVSLIAPASWALYTLLSKPLAERYSAVGAVGVCLIAGGVFLIPLLPHSLPAAVHLSAGGWAWLVFLAVGGSAIPYVLWAYSLRALPVARTAAFMYLVPVFALGWTALLLGEAPSPLALAGGLVVLAGVWLTQSAVDPALEPPRRARS